MRRLVLLFALAQAVVLFSGCGGTSHESGALSGAGSARSNGASTSASKGAGSESTDSSDGTRSSGASSMSAASNGSPASAGSSSNSSSGASQASEASPWVGTWTASPYPVPSGNLPPASLSNSVLRQVVHVSLGGSQIRVQFSNLSGSDAVTINSAHVALCKATPAVDSTIDTTTDTALAFSGKAAVTIAKGQEIWSDPVAFTVGALGNVSITTAFGTVPSALTGHAGSRTTSYQQTGSTNVSAPSMASAPTVDSWYYIAGMEVMADASAKAIVAIGDSLTDGRGTDTNMNNRWTDDLAVRMQANAATSNVAMMNQGIGGTNLVGTGTAAQARFARDVLGQSGVRYVIVFDGVNDIGGGASFASMMPVYASLISQAHGKGLLIYGATITPFGANSYYTAAHEAVRQQVNAYIKSGAFDGVLDFDAAVTDGGNPPKLQTMYDTWAQTDGLHLNPAGYQKLASVIESHALHEVEGDASPVVVDAADSEPESPREWERRDPESWAERCYGRQNGGNVGPRRRRAMATSSM